MDDFVNLVKMDLCSAMQADWENYAGLNNYERDALTQWNYLEEKLHYFYAKESYYNVLQRQKEESIVLSGDRGVGKTTMLAAICHTLKGEGWNVFPFFCTNTTYTESAEFLLQILTWSLEELIGEHIGIEQLSISDIQERMEECCEIIDSMGVKVLIAIDAIERLREDDTMVNTLSFLPQNEYKNIKLLLTVQEGYQFDTEINLSREKVTVGFMLSEVEMLLKCISMKQGKELSEESQILILRHILEIGVTRWLYVAVNPLYMTLIVQRLLMLDEVDYAKIHEIGDGIEAINAYILQLLADIPKDFVKLEYMLLQMIAERIDYQMLQMVIKVLACSQKGLSISVLDKVLSHLGYAFYELSFIQFVNYIENFFYRREDGRFDFANADLRKEIMMNMPETEKKHIYDALCICLQEMDVTDVHYQQEYLLCCYHADDKKGFAEEIARREKLQVEHNAAIYTEVANRYIDEENKITREQLKEIPMEWVLEAVLRSDEEVEVILLGIRFLNFGRMEDFSTKINHGKKNAKIYIQIIKFLKEKNNFEEYEEYLFQLLNALIRCMYIEISVREYHKAYEFGREAFKLSQKYEVLKTMTGMLSVELGYILEMDGQYEKALWRYRLVPVFCRNQSYVENQLARVKALYGIARIYEGKRRNATWRKYKKCIDFITEQHLLENKNISILAAEICAGWYRSEGICKEKNYERRRCEAAEIGVKIYEALGKKFCYKNSDTLFPFYETITMTYAEMDNHEQAFYAFEKIIELIDAYGVVTIFRKGTNLATADIEDMCKKYEKISGKCAYEMSLYCKYENLNRQNLKKYEKIKEAYELMQEMIKYDEKKFQEKIIQLGVRIGSVNLVSSEQRQENERNLLIAKIRLLVNKYEVQGGIFSEWSMSGMAYKEIITAKDPIEYLDIFEKIIRSSVFDKEVCDKSYSWCWIYLKTIRKWRKKRLSSTYAFIAEIMELIGTTDLRVVAKNCYEKALLMVEDEQEKDFGQRKENIQVHEAEDDEENRCLCFFENDYQEREQILVKDGKSIIREYESRIKEIYLDDVLDSVCHFSAYPALIERELVRLIKKLEYIFSFYLQIMMCCWYLDEEDVTNNEYTLKESDKELDFTSYIFKLMELISRVLEQKESMSEQHVSELEIFLEKFQQLVKKVKQRDYDMTQEMIDWRIEEKVKHPLLLSMRVVPVLETVEAKKYVVSFIAEAESVYDLVRVIQIKIYDKESGNEHKEIIAKNETGQYILKKTINFIEGKQWNVTVGVETLSGKNIQKEYDICTKEMKISLYEKDENKPLPNKLTLTMGNSYVVRMEQYIGSIKSLTAILKSTSGEQYVFKAEQGMNMVDVIVPDILGVYTLETQAEDEWGHFVKEKWGSGRMVDDIECYEKVLQRKIEGYKQEKNSKTYDDCNTETKEEKKGKRRFYRVF